MSLQIVMEYCGAGSVSDIMRIIERPVGVAFNSLETYFDTADLSIWVMSLLCGTVVLVTGE